MVRLLFRQRNRLRGPLEARDDENADSEERITRLHLYNSNNA